VVLLGETLLCGCRFQIIQKGMLCCSDNGSCYKATLVTFDESRVGWGGVFDVVHRCNTQHRLFAVLLLLCACM